ncbi:MAG: glycosyltransferase family 9 protein [Candidatus Binataceae bacterium]
MARAELARFATGRMGVAAGHSIDRREVSTLFRKDTAADSAARHFFRQFGKIYSFFAADDPDFCGALRGAASRDVSFHPFRPPGAGHIARLYLESIGAAGAPLELGIDLLDDDLESAGRVLRDLNVVRGKFLLVFPGSGSPAKNWPADRFAELAEQIAPVLMPIVVLGPAEERIEPNFRARDIPTLSGVGLETVGALARMAAGFIGNDSGVSHLAAASGARGVAIFGPTDPARWRPLGDVTIVRRDPLEALEVREVLNILRSDLVP